MILIVVSTNHRKLNSHNTLISGKYLNMQNKNIEFIYGGDC